MTDCPLLIVIFKQSLFKEGVTYIISDYEVSTIRKFQMASVLRKGYSSQLSKPKSIMGTQNLIHQKINVGHRCCE